MAGMAKIRGTLRMRSHIFVRGSTICLVRLPMTLVYSIVTEVRFTVRLPAKRNSKKPSARGSRVCVLRWSCRWNQPAVLSSSSRSSFPGSGAHCVRQSHPCGAGNVPGGLHPTATEQEADANRELWLRLCVCIRNGPRSFFFVK
jgi:hypothetical protein